MKTAEQILKTLYRELDYQSGKLLPAISAFSPKNRLSKQEWLDHGEWLAAANRAGASHLYFIDSNPVVVFAQLSDEIYEKVKVFNRVWSLGRPRLLILASPGEITVFDLAQTPFSIRSGSDDEPSELDKKWKEKSLASHKLNDIESIAASLAEFHRDQLDSGRLFRENEKRFGSLSKRADKALISDLKAIRRELIKHKPKKSKPADWIRFVHGLIGRSIFIRYLEDRGILDLEYFKSVARSKSGWGELLKQAPVMTGVDLTDRPVYFARILQSKEFTYSLFERLQKDFNGDMFPGISDEKEVVKQEHLDLLLRLLYGDTDAQQKLFLFAYDFNVVPLDLISSIYEEFYHTESEKETSTSDKEGKKTKAQSDGAHYTPPVLAEFVVSRTLTPEILKSNPRILDPACGSGIFLVEAFRRIVRYQCLQSNSSPEYSSLREILRNQISGIEVHEEAARVAAFSLYLAFLHYLEPLSIREQIKSGNRLPNLLLSENRSANHFNAIWNGNAFDTEMVANHPVVADRFGPGCADVIVGNPPWGGKDKVSSEESKIASKIMQKWLEQRKYTIGDGEPSQAFLLRAVELLKEGGKAGMLVSSGVLLKHHRKSKEFRESLLSRIHLNEVVNFIHVRKRFFSVDSPFLATLFTKEKSENSDTLYISIKDGSLIRGEQAIVISKYDLHYIRDLNPGEPRTWKMLWMGRQIDARFVNYLNRFERMMDYVDRDKSGQGFNKAAKSRDLSTLKKATKLAKLPFLQISSASRYGSLEFENPPEYVYRSGTIDAYYGKRLLVKRGVSQKNNTTHNIVARFETKNFCFTDAINGIKLKKDDSKLYLLLLGILWSSLPRYYFFLISSSWGIWHDEIYLEGELLQLPVVMDTNLAPAKEIIKIVNKLRTYQPEVKDLTKPGGTPEEEIKAHREKLEADLDEAVFKLYRLNDEQKDLIKDCCEITIPFYYRPFESIGTESAFSISRTDWMLRYAKGFARRWNPYLDNGLEMRAEVHVDHSQELLAVEFFPADSTDPWHLQPDQDDWQGMLARINKHLRPPMGTSQILLDSMVHHVSNDSIIIIKRNQKRFWTRSLAREDADGTILEMMNLTGKDNQGKSSGKKR